MGTKSALPKDNEVWKKNYCLSLPSTTLLCEPFKNWFYKQMAFNSKPTVLREMYKEPLIISYKKAKSLGDILLRAKL